VGPTIAHARSRRPQSCCKKLEHLPETLADSTFPFQYGWLRHALCRGDCPQTTKTCCRASLFDSKLEGFRADRVRERFQAKKPMARYNQREWWKRSRARRLYVGQSNHIRCDWSSWFVCNASPIACLLLRVFQALTTASTRLRMTQTNSSAHTGICLNLLSRSSSKIQSDKCLGSTSQS